MYFTMFLHVAITMEVDKKNSQKNRQITIVSQLQYTSTLIEFMSEICFTKTMRFKMSYDDNTL